MSRIGKKPVLIPAEVKASQKDEIVCVEGPKGSLSLKIPFDLKVEIKEGEMEVLTKSKEKKARVLQGTIRQLLFNMVKGVSEGWSKTLEIVGTGFRATLEGEKLLLSLGFSHQVELVPPQGVVFTVSERKVVISGPDKIQVGRIAQRIKEIKPPDAYKGKGIRFEGEQIKLKPGKQVKAGLAGVTGGAK